MHAPLPVDITLNLTCAVTKRFGVHRAFACWIVLSAIEHSSSSTWDQSMTRKDVQMGRVELGPCRRVISVAVLDPNVFEPRRLDRCIME
jgi:hypothetical protein